MTSTAACSRMRFSRRSTQTLMTFFAFVNTSSAPSSFFRKMVSLSSSSFQARTGKSKRDVPSSLNFLRSFSILTKSAVKFFLKTSEEGNSKDCKVFWTSVKRSVSVKTVVKEGGFSTSSLAGKRNFTSLRILIL